MMLDKKLDTIEYTGTGKTLLLISHHLLSQTMRSMVTHSQKILRMQVVSVVSSQPTSRLLLPTNSILVQQEKSPSTTGQLNSQLLRTRRQQIPMDTTTMILTPQLIKELRELTGAGMMDCKNAPIVTGKQIGRAHV